MNTPTLRAAMLAAAILPGCGGGASAVRGYPAPSVSQVVDRLQDRAASVTAVRSESVMDYWVGDQRVKGDVYLMGRVGARLRFNALNPTGGTVAVDLACDGSGYQLIDYNNNCQLSGPCDGAAIAQLLRVRLEPDDFYLLSFGAVPLLPDARGTITWDPDDAVERVVLTAPDGRRQTLVLDGREQRWDVIEATLRDARGRVDWQVENKDFRAVTNETGAPIRVPGKTRFTQPAEDADLIVDWREFRLNPTLADGNFSVEVPAGLPFCGAKRPERSTAP